MTPSLYSSASSFKQLAILNGKTKTINGLLCFQPILLNPEPHTQIKPKTTKIRKAEDFEAQVQKFKDPEELKFMEDIRPKEAKQKQTNQLKEKQSPVKILLKEKNNEIFSQPEEKKVRFIF